MLTPSHRILRTASVLLFIGVLVSMCAGCVGIMAQLLHVGFGNKVKAKYDGFGEQKVAVICVSESSQFGPTKAAIEIAEEVQKNLELGILDIELIPQQEIDIWMDENNWNQIDYRELGQGIGAQKLLVIEMSSFSLYEGRTLFKGRCDLDLTVYDLTSPGSEPVFELIPPQIQFPITAGVYTADTSEEAFRRKFIGIISRRVARNFFNYDAADEYSQDPTALGF